MNVLFIYPEMPDTFWSFKHALRFVSKKAAFPPLGLLTIASLVPAHWNKKLVDMNVRRLEDKDLMWADYVFISAMHVQKKSTIKVIDRCKKFEVKVVAGGPYFTTSSDEFPEIDHLILGEAEDILPAFFQDLNSGTPKRCYTSDTKPDLSLTPLPHWDLIDFKNYDSMLVQFSRGCPFDCEFCDIVLLNGRKQRTKSPYQFVQEIDTLYKKGWRGTVFVVDDNFIGTKKKVKEMLRSLGQWMEENDRPFHFLTEASINLAEDKELMDLMTYAGFNKVFIGVETPNEESLKETNKHQNTRKNLMDAVRTIQKNGMEVMGGFIIGFDSDPSKIFDMQIDFIQSSGITTAMVGLLQALPGTKLWQRLRSEGRLLAESSGNNTDYFVNFIPRMDAAKLTEGYKRVIETIYSPRAYYKRCIVFLKTYRQKTVSKIDASCIKAFLKSVWHIGIKNEGKFRKYYWKLLIKSLIINPKMFGEAVRLAIVEIHFQKSFLAQARKTS
jgi:radical SAM superfamily enzyme YgiQ (UPF0313 family)